MIGWSVSKGRPSRVSIDAPLSWSAKAMVRSRRLATRSRRIWRSSSFFGASIALVCIRAQIYQSPLGVKPLLRQVTLARKIQEPVPEYAALDLETTGLDPARDRVIEVGAVAFTPDGVTASMERLVDPGRSVPEPVLRLTGINPEELRGAARPETALRELSDFLRGRQPVGHGARLDVDFL